MKSESRMFKNLVAPGAVDEFVCLSAAEPATLAAMKLKLLAPQRSARLRPRISFFVIQVRRLAFLLCLTAFVFDASAAFRAGIALRNVTPDPLLPVSGGVGPSHPVTRKEGELSVRALALEQEGTRVAIVSADFLGFPAVLGNQVRAAVKDIPAQNILIGATHTHSAPDCYGFRDLTGVTGRNAKY